MPAGITTTALLAPIIASNAIFSTRRASKGVDTMEENPLFGTANMTIASAQVLKSANAAQEVAQSLGILSEGSTNLIKKASAKSKLIDNACKAYGFTSNNINSVICLAGLMNVLGSEDPIDEGARESLRLGSMFAFEKGAKSLLGMPKTEYVDGNLVASETESSLKKILNERQIKAINDFCATRKYMKYAPNFAKGVLFAGASIIGYKAGDSLSNKLLGEKENNKTVN